MPDVLSIVAVAALFLVAIVYVGACESLKRPKGGR
jgi:hypothetical protein